MGRLFGTDGIRGKYGDVITESLAKKVAYALPCFNIPVVLVGMDTRESSLSLKNELIKALKQVNFNVHDFNVISTPALMYLSYRYKCLAVMITASHNPYEDNGIKVIKCGYKLNDEEIDLLESNMSSKLSIMGNDIPLSSLYEYQKLLTQFKISPKLKVLFDLSNGATTYIAKDILSNYNFKYQIINDKPNGKNINDKCGSTNISLLKKNIKKYDVDYAFAFDGDGDRVIALDREGRVYDGNHLIYIFANYIQLKTRLDKKDVVLTIDSNPGVIQSLEKKGFVVSQSSVGDRNVVALMNEVAAEVGGEESGHIIVKEFSPTGDGLLNALFTLSIITDFGQSLAELTEGVVEYPVLKENLSEFNEKAVTSAKLKNVIEGHKKSLLSRSLILVRKSGTEHLLRISISTGDTTLDKEIYNEIYEVVRSKEE